MGFRLRPRTTDELLDGARKVGGALGHPCVYDLLDFARLPMAIVEGDTQIVCYVNPSFCQLARRSSKELLGRPFAKILPAGDKCLLLLDRVYRTGKPESHTEQEDAAPHPLYWSYEIWPVLAESSEDDRPAGVIIQITETAPFHRRVTAMNEALLCAAVRQQELTEAALALNTKLQAEMKERKQAQEALLRSEMLASAGRLAASIAHEINNPLEAVMNTLYLARASVDRPDSAREYLEIADGELLRIAHITRQTLGFYRESAEATTTSVSALMASVVDLLQSKIRSSGAAIEQQCEEHLQVMAVFGELRQVLANLLANSLDAVGENAVVKLRCSTSRSPSTGRRYIRMTVADNGRGIDAATMKDIFEPFFTTKGTVGTGLGLWVCKQLVDKNGGSIWVRSNTDGKRRGTTFSVVLPGAAIQAETGQKLGKSCARL